MKILFIIAIFAVLIWLYGSTIRDVYLFFKSIKTKKALAKLKNDAISTEAEAIIRAGEKRNVNHLGNLINAANLDTIVETSVGGFKSKIIEKLAQKNQDDPGVRYLNGFDLIKKAWEVRGSGYAHTVSRKKSEKFFYLLNQAERELLKVRELDQSFVGVFSPLLIIATNSGSREKAEQIYNEARQSAPDQLDYHLSMLILLTEKWMGSDEEMFEFARENADRGSGALNGLIPAAHFEIWLVLEDREEEAYFNDPQVQKEIYRAFEGIKIMPKGNGFIQQYQQYLALNYFAFAFQMIGDYKTASTIYHEIGGHYGDRPWVNLGSNPGLTYMEYRNNAFKGK